jgi:hypothetical protein
MAKKIISSGKPQIKFSTFNSAVQDINSNFSEIYAALGGSLASAINIGTTSVPFNRSSSALSLTGVSIDGNAGTVTNGVVTSGSYSNPTWITSIAGSKLSGTVIATNGVVTTDRWSNPDFIQTLDGAKVTNAVLTTGTYANPSWITTISASKVFGTVSSAAAVLNGVYTTDSGTVTNTMLAGGIANSKLTNSSLTIGSTTISLGNTTTGISGLTSLAATNITGDLVGDIYTTNGQRVLDNGTNYADPAFFGDIYAGDGVTKILSNGTNGTDATFTGTLQTGAQPNITSVGTLSALTVTATITGSVSGNAGTVTNGLYTTSSHYIGTTNIAFNRSSGNQSLTGVSIDGSAGSVSASNLSSGTIPSSVLANSTVYIGTTGIALNRATGSLSLAGVSIDGSAGKSTNLIGGNATTLLGSIPYQSATDTTTLLGPNTTTTQKFLAQTGNGTNGAAPGWVTVDAGGLSGTTLNSGVTASSLTSVGTLISLTTGGLKFTGLQTVAPNYIAVSTTSTQTLSTTTSFNIIIASTTSLTVTLNMPTSPADGQYCRFAVHGNTVTLAAGTGTISGPYAGSATVGTAYTYVYRNSTTTWYRV